MAEAAFNFRLGVSARRSSYSDRSSDRKSRSHRREINDGPKASTHPCYIRVVVPEPPHFAAARHKAEKLARPHAHHRIVVPEPTHSRDHRKPAHLHGHRIIVPEASHSWDTTFHAFCVTTDVTYARLSERLDRLRDHKATIALRLRSHGGSKASWESLELVQNDIRKLELTLKGMRQKIEERKGEWNGKGDVFMFRGRWAAFL